MEISNKFDKAYIEKYFEMVDLRPGQREYVNFHKIRYQYLINIIDGLINKHSFSPANILDIGPRYQTNLIRDSIDDTIVNTLGFKWDNNNSVDPEYHLEVDLNETDDIDVSVYQKNDIVVFAEVVEHLYTTPHKVLGFLKSLMTEDGYMIIQTPNGVALNRRITMLLGENPYDLIHENRQNHYREYTIKELSEIAEKAGFKIAHSSITNYFNPDKTLFQKIYNKLNSIIPPTLRSGITLVLQNSPET